MNKFLFKSTNADFQKFNQSLEIIQKNILYTTYQTDKIIKMLKLIGLDKSLQKQVDDYYDDKETDIPEELQRDTHVE